MVWGGDGHEHWHIERVASVWLVKLGGNGKPATGAKKLVDTKVGFCFYDHTHELARGPENGVYSARTLCEQRGRQVAPSSAWGCRPAGTTRICESLPGQSIDITALADGKYRLFTEIDEPGLFREATRTNNLTWIDLDLETTPNGRIAIRTATGPRPQLIDPGSASRRR